MILKDHLWSFKIILKPHSKRASVGGYSARPRRRRPPMKPDSAMFIAVRPKDAQSGAGGAGAAAAPALDLDMVMQIVHAFHDTGHA